MDEPLKLLIPLLAILMVFLVPITWFYFDSRNKEARYRAMERLAQSGQDPKMLQRLLETEPEKVPAKRQPYRSGLICMAIGASLLLAQRAGGSQDAPPNWIGLLLLFLGGALLLADFLNRGRAARGRDDGPGGPDFSA